MNEEIKKMIASPYSFGHLEIAEALRMIQERHAEYRDLAVSRVKELDEEVRSVHKKNKEQIARIQQLEREVEDWRHMFDVNTEALSTIAQANDSLGEGIKKLQSKLQIAKDALNEIIKNDHSSRNGLQDIAYWAIEEIDE